MTIATDERTVRLLEKLDMDVAAVRESVAELRGQVASVLDVRRDLASHEASDASIHAHLSTSAARTTWLAGATLVALIGAAAAIVLRGGVT